MKIRKFSVAAVLLSAFFSSCSGTDKRFPLHRGISGSVKTAKGDYIAKYSSWRTHTPESAEGIEVGVGVIAPFEFAGEWMLASKKARGSDQIVLAVLDKQGEEQQRFVVNPNTVYFLKHPYLSPVTLDNSFQPKRMFDPEPIGTEGEGEYVEYTRNLLEKSAVY